MYPHCATQLDEETRVKQPELSGGYKAGWQLGGFGPIDVTTYITPRWAAQLDEETRAKQSAFSG